MASNIGRNLDRAFRANPELLERIRRDNAPPPPTAPEDSNAPITLNDYDYFAAQYGDELAIEAISPYLNVDAINDRLPAQTRSTGAARAASQIAALGRGRGRFALTLDDQEGLFNRTPTSGEFQEALEILQSNEATGENRTGQDVRTLQDASRRQSATRDMESAVQRRMTQRQRARISFTGGGASSGLLGGAPVARNRLIANPFERRV